jgi:hypothetical protein
MAAWSVKKLRVVDRKTMQQLPLGLVKKVFAELDVGSGKGVDDRRRSYLLEPILG